MLDETPTTGSLDSTVRPRLTTPFLKQMSAYIAFIPCSNCVVAQVEEKKAIAAESAQKILKSQYRTLFPQLPDLIRSQAAKQEGEAEVEAEGCGHDSPETAGEGMRPGEDCTSSPQPPQPPQPSGEGDESPNVLQQEACSEADAAGRPEEQSATVEAGAEPVVGEEEPRHLLLLLLLQVTPLLPGCTAGLHSAFVSTWEVVGAGTSTH